MDNKNSDLIKILIIVALILVIYLLSEKYFKVEPPAPTYQTYDQDNRLQRIRKGLTGK